MPYLANLVVLTVLIGSALAWTYAGWRFVTGQSLLPFEPRRAPTWGFAHVAFAAGLFFCWQVLAAAIVMAAGWHGEGDWTKVTVTQAVARMTASAAANLGWVSAVTALLLSGGGGWPSLGVVWRRLGEDLALGFIAFLLLAPPVYAIQLLLVQWVKSEHPLLMLLQANPHPALLASVSLVAVVSAPLSEEVAFRLLFQGWLEKLAAYPRDAARVWLGDAPTVDGGRRGVAAPGGNRPRELAAPAGAASPEDAVTTHESETPTAAEKDAYHPPTWPLGASALVFALMHWPHGPDWIPLTVLALGLGWLFHRTHRLLPCVVVHCLLNGCSLLLLTTQLYGPK